VRTQIKVGLSVLYVTVAIAENVVTVTVEHFVPVFVLKLTFADIIVHTHSNVL